MGFPRPSPLARSNATAYRAAWQREWDAIGREEVPYIPTASSPGVCNKGGVKTECYETDRRVGVRPHLAGTLHEVKVPAEYEPATALTLEALTEWARGLSLRMSALEVGHTEAEREEWWRAVEERDGESSSCWLGPTPRSRRRLGPCPTLTPGASRRPAMLLEYLDDPSLPKPVLLMYGGAPPVVVVLGTALGAVVRGGRCNLTSCPGLAASAARSRCERVTPTARRPIEGRTDNAFECIHRAATWETVEGLLVPFATPRGDRGHGHQYLTEAGTIEWIVSTDRSW